MESTQQRQTSPPGNEQRQPPRPPPGAGISQKLLGRLAEKYGVPAGAILQVLRDTAFKVKKGESPFSDAEMAAVLIVAEKLDLNPFAREIYATRNQGALLIIVGVDGWVKIANRQKNYDGAEFSHHVDKDGKPISVLCRIHLKDREHPIEVEEFFEECVRDTFPWRQHPRRMLRHKAFIQASRLAFGLSGIVDEDEAEGIIEASRKIEGHPASALPAPSEMPRYDIRGERRGEPAPVYSDSFMPPDLEAELAAAAPPPPAEDLQAPEPAPEAPPAAPPPSPHPALRQASGTPVDLWAKWSKARQGLSAENLQQIKRQLGIEGLTPGTPAEKLEEAIIIAGEILGR